MQVSQNVNRVRTWKIFADPVTYSKFVVMVTVIVIMLLCYHSYLYGLVTVSTIHRVLFKS